MQDVLRDLFAPRRRHQVDFAQRDDAVRDTEEIDDGEMLDGLRHHAVVGRDDQQNEINARRPGQHVAHEFLMPRHIDEPEDRAIVGRQVGEAEIDGNAARLLLFQPVGIDAGERMDQRSLAVVDVARRSNDHGEIPEAGRSRAVTSSAARLAIKPASSSRQRKSRIKA